MVSLNGDGEEHALAVRVSLLESGVADMITRVNIHERALFGGVDKETGHRQIGLFEELAHAVSELRKISETLNKAFQFGERLVRSVVSWIGRLVLMGIAGLGTILWFCVTHWAAIAHYIARTVK